MSAVISLDNLTDAECRSLVVARNKIARSLAGRQRLLHELATGKPAVAGDIAKTPPNPQGLLGVDRSGFPWGPAFQHPVWVGDGNLDDTAAIFNPRPWCTSGTEQLSWEIVVRARPFQPRMKAPYSRAYFAAQVAAIVASSSTCTVTLDFNGRSMSADITTSSTTGVTATPDLYADLLPGLNRGTLRIAESAGTSMIFMGVSLNQIVERTH